MKQVKINCWYTSEELSAFRLVIYKSLADSAKEVVLVMEKIGVDFVEDINRMSLNKQYTPQIFLPTKSSKSLASLYRLTS
ncbi:hypothetical protein FRB94_010239 [Tulasnella sp. JGI-2019a]|nr:hypothetical protein FRB94_010239 [Tulasnella sp. JGI-2019a]KAG9033982.1 hypothetical protein FRB95_013955 [Tulasnella sp. JGI-2019a]